MKNSTLLSKSITLLKELLLLTAGIFIALALNNWNAERTLKNKVHDYLGKILVELEENNPSEKRFCQELQDRIQALEELDLNSNEEFLFLDSAQVEALQFSRTWPRRFPVFENFKNEGLITYLDNEVIEGQIFSLYQGRQTFDKTSGIFTQDHKAQVMPFLIRNLFETDNEARLPKNIETSNTIRFQISQLKGLLSQSMGHEAVLQIVNHIVSDELQEKK